MSAEAGDRLKRIRLRSWRRGTREMDLILGPFADAGLGELDAAELAAFESLLSQDDQQLYQWIGGQCSIPHEHRQMVARIRAYHRLG